MSILTEYWIKALEKEAKDPIGYICADCGHWFAYLFEGNGNCNHDNIRVHWTPAELQFAKNLTARYQQENNPDGPQISSTAG